MNQSNKLQRDERFCPICREETQKTLFLKKRIIEQEITSFTFASRKEPEFMRHQLVQCNECDLVYANKPPSQSLLHESYHEADYDSQDEANDAADAYIKAMRQAFSRLNSKDRALDIGTGDGIFLEYLAKEGFKNPEGIEPSHHAIESAPLDRQLIIKNGIFNEKDYEQESFDLITCFMTMEHVLDPFYVASSAIKLLKPGGAFITVTHNYRSLVNRILGSKSPIIDIEHMQLFSNESILELMKVTGFVNVSNKSFKNKYQVLYWIKLLPLPSAIKHLMRRILVLCKLNKLKLSINVGNQITCAFKKL